MAGPGAWKWNFRPTRGIKNVASIHLRGQNKSDSAELFLRRSAIIFIRARVGAPSIHPPPRRGIHQWLSSVCFALRYLPGYLTARIYPHAARAANIISYRILLYLLCSRLQIHDQNQFELIKSSRARAVFCLLSTFQPLQTLNIFFFARTQKGVCMCGRWSESTQKFFTALLFRPNCYYMVLYHGHISLAIIGLAGWLACAGIISHHLSSTTRAATLLRVSYIRVRRARFH